VPQLDVKNFVSRADNSAAVTHRRLVVAAALLPLVSVIAWHFPYATDDPVRREDEIKAFYDSAWSAEPDGIRVVQDTPEVRDATNARFRFDVNGRVQRFVETFDLQRAKVLDVGSGTGYLQDIVDDYTGIDISSTAARHYHKPFVAGTATAMPFADNTFDAAWSIWVIEHIPNPEAALAEIRRVVKPGGVLYLMPAWMVDPWAAEGHAARPYSDFGVGGRIVKAGIPIRRSLPFWFITTVPNRIIRSVASFWGPTRLRYSRLTPNYEEYWQADSDAVNRLDSTEMAMWFESRGDSCLSCLGHIGRYFQFHQPLIIRLNAEKG